MRKLITFEIIVVALVLAVTLSIMAEWHMGFWSNTLPVSVYIMTCVAYAVFIGCIVTGTWYFFRDSKQI